MNEQIEKMDKKRRQLLSVNLVFIFVYLAVMMWEFVATSGNQSVVINMNDYKRELDAVQQTLKSLPESFEQYQDEESLKRIESYKEQPLPESNQKLESDNELLKKNTDKALNLKDKSLGLLKDLEVFDGYIVPDVETPHFFWIIVLAFQVPMSLLIYLHGRKIKSDPAVYSALNNELVQYNRMSAWRVAFFAAIIPLFILALIHEKYFNLGWVAVVATCTGAAGYIITFLKLDRGE